MNRRRTGTGRRRTRRRTRGLWARLRGRWEQFDRERAARFRARVERSRLPTSPRASRAPTALALLFALSLAAGVLASPSLLSGTLPFSSRPRAAVERIEIQGNRLLSPWAVAAATGIARGEAEPIHDADEIERRLTRHPWIRSAAALQLPTGELWIRIGERSPRAVVRHAAERSDARPGAWLFVDETGTPFAEAPTERIPAHFPRLRSRRALALGEPDPDLERAIRLARTVTAAGVGELVERSELELPHSGSQDGWVLHLGPQGRRAILGEEALPERLQRLALLLDSDLEETRGAREIDLRFADRAVLRGTPASR